MRPLFTCIILCYRNFAFIYDALDSVFAQNYENIELIVSDDGSDSFPSEDIEQYIEANKSDNIRFVTVRSESENIGTVRHLNAVFSLAQGDYMHSLSADDAYASTDAVSAFVENFDPSHYDILMSQTAMCGLDIRDVESYFVQRNIIDILETVNTSDYQLFQKLVEYPFLPSASTMFTREFFLKHDKFDESYRLIEDWPLHLRLAREHVPIQYMDVVTVHHRSGGISHGNIVNSGSTYGNFIDDLTRCFMQEVRPYRNLLEEELYKRLRRKMRRDADWNDRKRLGKFAHMWKYPDVWAQRLLRGLHPLWDGRVNIALKRVCIWMVCLPFAEVGINAVLNILFGWINAIRIVPIVLPFLGWGGALLFIVKIACQIGRLYRFVDDMPQRYMY